MKTTAPSTLICLADVKRNMDNIFQTKLTLGVPSTKKQIYQNAQFVKWLADYTADHIQKDQEQLKITVTLSVAK